MGCENKGDPLFSSKDGQMLSEEDQIGNILGFVGHRVSTIIQLYENYTVEAGFQQNIIYGH